jgi:hypothetical protein
MSKFYLGSRMTDGDKKKIEEALAQLARHGRLVQGDLPPESAAVSIASYH